jgi:non-specific protein-tyrosine kinase
VVAALILVPYYLDDSVKDAEDARHVVDLSVLGSVRDGGPPRGLRGIGRRRAERGKPRLATHRQPRSPAAEAYRTARWNIEFAADGPLHTLLLTSPAHAEGKTIVTANLAIAFAQAGRRVLLVDADLRRPGVHSLFGLANDRGLTTLLTNERTKADTIVHTTAQRGLSVLTAGPVPSNPAELLGAEHTRTTFEQLRTTCDLIVVDSPPLEAAADAAILSTLADGTVLVVDIGKSRRGSLQNAVASLGRAGAQVLGALLVELPDRTYSQYADPQAHAMAGDEPADARVPTTRKSTSGSAS